MGHLVTFSLDMVDSDVVLLPPIESMKGVTIHIAVKVGLQAQKDGVAQEMSEQELYERVQKKILNSRISKLQIYQKGYVK